jgi:hypothetical protein
LTGLLFVAVSVKGAALINRGVSVPRGANARAFMISVLIAVVLAAPQPASAIGWELLAVAVLSGAALLVLDLRAGHAR